MNLEVNSDVEETKTIFIDPDRWVSSVPCLNVLHQFHDLHGMNFRFISHQMNAFLVLDVSFGRITELL